MKKVSWDYYSKRRSVNLIELLKSGQINSYEHLCEICEKKAVEPPTKSEYQVAESVALPKPDPVPSKRTSAKPSVPKKKRAPRAKK